MNVKSQLIELAESNYQQFTSRLLPGISNILGVRLPVLRKIAKEIAKQNWRTFLKTNDEMYFEEIMLKGMVIGYIKNIPLHEQQKLIQDFIPKINNWSICDSFCSGLKMTEQYKREMWPLITSYLSSTSEYEVRFAIVMMLNYYVDNQYVNEVLDKLDQVQHKGYYAQMAAAWAVSICYINYPQLTLAYLNHNELDDFTYNKALQKIRESLKSDLKTKQLMQELKRKV